MTDKAFSVLVSANPFAYRTTGSPSAKGVLTAVLLLTAARVEGQAHVEMMYADVQHSSISFTTRHWGLSRVRGQFDRWSAAITYAADAVERSSVTVVVEVGSLNTSNRTRDAELTANWFEVATYPVMVFHSSRIERQDSGFVAVGQLALKRTVREIAVQFVELGQFTSHNGVPGRAFRARFAIDRKQFGVTAEHFFEQAGAVSDSVELEIELQEISADPAQHAFARRGRPQSAGEVLYSVARARGSAPALRRWAELRAQPDSAHFDAAEVEKAIHRLIRDGDKATALDLTGPLASTFGESPGISRSLGVIYLRLGNREMALRHFTAAAERLPTDALTREYARLLGRAPATRTGTEP